MLLRNGARILPKLRSLFCQKNTNALRIQTPLVACRGLHQRRNDPFAQMENFIRDMERKFWGDVHLNFPWVQSLPRFRLPSESSVVSAKYPTNIWGPSDVSTSDKFKLTFNFPQANPDDIKVTLKDRLLTIEAKIEEADDTTKMNQTFNFQYTIPESVDVELLESVFSQDGILIIEAPKTPDEVPKTINIKRE